MASRVRRHTLCVASRWICASTRWLTPPTGWSALFCPTISSPEADDDNYRGQHPGAALGSRGRALRGGPPLGGPLLRGRGNSQRRVAAGRSPPPPGRARFCPTIKFARTKGAAGVNGTVVQYVPPGKNLARHAGTPDLIRGALPVGDEQYGAFRYGHPLFRARGHGPGDLEPLERPFEVGDDVFRVLDAHGEPDQVLPDPQPFPARGRELAVGGGRRVYGEVVDVPEARGPHAQRERIQEREGRFPSLGLQLEGDEAPGVREHAAGDLRVRVVFEAGVVDLRYLFVGGEVGGDQACVLALALHPERQCLEAPMSEPGLEGAQGPADEFPYPLQCRIVRGPRRDDPGRQVAVAREVLGRAVDDQVRAHFERALQAGGAEGVVHH